MMNSQLLKGGHKIEDTPQFRLALEERQTLLLKEFDQKLQEFEKERNQIEEDKAQVERYKQLVLKQRDIMIALTTKLNERDEDIVQLQEELETYDKFNRDIEDNLEEKDLLIKEYERLLVENNIKQPEKIIKIKERANLKNNRRQNEKLYIPYEIEKYNKEFENSPITLITAEEKIRELNTIVKEQEV